MWTPLCNNLYECGILQRNNSLIWRNGDCITVEANVVLSREDLLRVVDTQFGPSGGVYLQPDGRVVITAPCHAPLSFEVSPLPPDEFPHLPAEGHATNVRTLPPHITHLHNRLGATNYALPIRMTDKRKIAAESLPASPVKRKPALSPSEWVTTMKRKKVV